MNYRRLKGKTCKLPTGQNFRLQCFSFQRHTEMSSIWKHKFIHFNVYAFFSSSFFPLCSFFSTERFGLRGSLNNNLHIDITDQAGKKPVPCCSVHKNRPVRRPVVLSAIDSTPPPPNPQFAPGGGWRLHDINILHNGTQSSGGVWKSRWPSWATRPY